MPAGRTRAKTASICQPPRSTGNLDPASADVVVAELRRRADAGACVLIVTHTPTVAEACDETIELG